eukprot:7399095-Pyramimonas_sp.AAC.1
MGASSTILSALANRCWPMLSRRSSTLIDAKSTLDRHCLIASQTLIDASRRCRQNCEDAQGSHHLLLWAF